nr:adenylate/guanylate cyclase domain-containing protein [Nocardioides luti]
MQCGSCNAQSPDGAKFCLECGSPLARRCPSCGTPDAGGKFCIECGTPMAAAATAAAPAATSSQPVSERRTTTVLFGDLVSFTTLSESRDPEEVRELLSAYFATARTVVGRYGGTIEKFIGDAVMAVWGVPVSHEDDAERAVRAGLDLVAAVAELGESVGAPELAMRVGIVTGSVAVTLGAVNEGMVAGDAVNTAARVQTAADPGTVWVDQETYGLTSAAVAFSDRGEHALKGKAEPVRLFRADAVVAAVGGAQRVDGLEAPMVGRDRELRRVKDLFHATQEDGRARIALVTGEAGLGKSRLGWEFEKYVDGLNDEFRWHRGRCLSYGDGVAFWAFAEMVRSRLGILEGDEAGEVDRKLRAGVEAVCATPSEAAWLTPRIAALLGSGAGTFDRTDLFASWTTFLERVGGDLPVVLLFEDFQHADTGLLDLVEHLLETIRARLYVLTFTRPELLERRPTLAASRRATLVDLPPLGDEAMSVLLDGLVADLPSRARQALVSRAAGVPLYAVETVRSLIDRDAVVAREGRYVFVDHDHARVDLDQLQAPTSLQTLIAARLDTLTPQERRVVQDASVLGLTFRLSALEALSGLGAHELDAPLAGLVRKGVLGTQNDPRSPELGQYRFVQAIVREVAYSTLARKDRRLLHLAAADHLEQEEAAESLAGVIAQQLLDALEASSADDPDRQVVTDRARGLLVAAAQRAQSLGSQDEALRQLLAAIALHPLPEEDARLHLLACQAAFHAGLPGQAEELSTRAAVLGREVGDASAAASALVYLARTRIQQGRPREAGQAADEGIELVDGTEDRAGRGVEIELLMARGASSRALGDYAQQQAATLRLLPLADDFRDPALRVRALNALGLMLTDLRSPTAYLAVLERAVKIAREERLLGELLRSLNNMISETYTEDLAAAAEIAAEAVVVARQVGESQQTEHGLINAGFTWWLRGDWDEAHAHLREWLDGHEPTAMASTLRLIQAFVLTARGEPLPDGRLADSEDAYEQYGADLVTALRVRATGDVATAARLAAEAGRRQYGSLETYEDIEVQLPVAVELQLEAGDLTTARELLGMFEPLAGERGRAITRGELPRLRALVALAAGEDPETDLREAESAHAAYGAPYLLARTRLDLGRWLLGRDRRDEALPLLAAAREVFARLGAHPSLADVDALDPAPALTTTGVGA